MYVARKPTTLSRPAAKRTSRERGNGFLEAALALGPFFMILFAIIDFSVAVLMKNTVQDAAREGVRYAITGQTMAGKGQDASIKAIVQQYGMGFISDPSKISITYFDPNNSFKVTNSNAGGNIVQVQVSGMSWAWMCPYARDATALQYSASSSDIVEPSPNAIPPAR